MVNALLAIWQVSDDEAVVTPCHRDLANDAPMKDVGRHDEVKNEDYLLS